MKRLLVFVLFVGILAAGVKLGLGLYLAQGVLIEQPVLVDVKKGAGLTVVAHELRRKNVIDHPRLFVKVGQLYGYDKRLKYGEYEVTPGLSFGDVLDKISSGDTYKYKITFVEGDHMYAFARQIEEAGLGKKQNFLKLVKDKRLIQKLIGENLSSLEGYLYPDTYKFSKNEGLETIVRTMVNQFKEKTRALNFASKGMSRHQVVTLASIIEKETGAPFERPMISSVFHNRLRKKMRLQTDPTIIYGIMDETGREINNIRKKDIKRPTAYNTYVIKGLPPGPIANPGIESIKAAISPKPGDYLFFVSQNDGTHVFTTNYKDHQKAVKKYQLDAKARKGKSWRDLKRKQGGR